MSNIVPFESNTLPAHILADKSTGNEFGFANSGPSIDTLSSKGKVFTINSGGVKTMVNDPTGEPARALEVVILNSAPKGGLYQKTFYPEGYVDGANAKPTCHSTDGVSPHSSAQEKQASKCALCPQNAKGSGATAQNPNAKACRSSKVLAVAAAGNLTKPMLLRVPGASTLALKEFGEKIAVKGVKAHQVITRISFDFAKAYPALTFKPTGFTTPEMNATVAEQRESDLVKVIIGEKALNELKSAEPEQDIEEEADYVPPPKVEAPKAAKAKAAPVVEDDDDLPAAPVAKVKVEAEAVKPVARKTAPKAEVVSDEGFDKALDGLDFDD